MITDRTRCNLITGFVGAGKSTVILGLLAQRPANERWAVLVNGTGAVRVRENAGVAVREVAGGCPCCTAQVTMRVALTRLLRETRPHRLLIELTSAGHLANVVRLLREPELQRALELRAMLCVVDPDQFARNELSARDDYREPIALAEVVIASKCDVAPRTRIEAVLALARGMQPARAVVEAANGKVEAALLDAGALESASEPRRGTPRL